MTKTKLNLHQEKFCKLYVSSDFYGNGVKSYIEAYNPDQDKPNWYNTAKSNASRLLADKSVCYRINELLDKEGLNDAFVDKQLLHLISQHGDKSVKLSAIRHYNGLKQRVIKRVEFSNEIDLKRLSTVELLEQLEELNNKGIV